MELARVVEVLKRAPRSPSWELRSPDAEPVARAGLWCSRCGGEVRRQAERRSQVAYGSDSLLADDHVCGNPGCGAVRVPARVVYRELQAFTVRRWSDHRFVARWRRARLGELEAEIAELLAVHGWATDPQHRWKVNRELGGRRLSLFDGGDKTLQHYLSILTSHTVGQVYHRERLKAALGRKAAAGATASLGELFDLSAAYHRIVDVILRSPRYPEELWARFGDRKQQATARDDVGRRLWDMPAETEWRDVPPADSPAADGALGGDWGASLASAVGRRHAFLDLAAVGYRLELEPQRGATVRLRARRVSPAGD